MMLRWIWFVPSMICTTLASRKYRLIGYSADTPAAPNSCTASVATRIATSEAKHFAIAAIGASALPLTPASTIAAVR